MTRVRRVAGLTLGLGGAVVLILAGAPAAAETDVVTLVNGDRLTGEVKGLERGKLAFKTDATDTIQIDWTHVASLRASKTFELETQTGERYLGSLAPAGQGRLEVVGWDQSWTLETLSVVSIVKIKEGFWNRIEGFLDLGFGFTQAEDRLQFSFGAEAGYRTPKYLRTLSFNFIRASQTDVDTTDRQDLNLWVHRKLRRPKRTLVLLASLQRNAQLNLDLRSLAGVGAGWAAIQTNTELFDLFGGAVVTSENLGGEEPRQESIEAVLGLRFQSFRYETPKRVIDIGLSVFPSLSQSGRVRGELRAKISWEIVKDLTFGLTLLESYDSRPATEGAQQTDLSLTSSLGWSF